MKFQLISDLHLEYYKDVPDINKILIPAAPNLILAGNICYAKHSNFVPFFEKISKLYKSIYYILGNNEYYNNITSNNYIYGNIFNGENIDIYVKDNIINSLEDMLSSDFNSYLPDDILCKVDRASMSESLESRSPYLDDELVSYSSHIPIKEKISDKENKIPLKNILRKYLPKELITNQKRGFGIPLDSWLRNDLRPWAEELLSKKNVDSIEIFKYSEIQHIWNIHISKKGNMQNILWPILMFQDWNNN